MLLGLERGEAPFSPGIAGKFLEEFRRLKNEAGASPAEKELIDAELTPRQVEILALTARGMTYKEIGAALCLSERAIKYHMGEIIAKLHLGSRLQAVALARRAGLTAGI